MNLGQSHEDKAVEKGLPDALPQEFVPQLSVCFPGPFARDCLVLVEERHLKVIQEPEKQVTHTHGTPVDYLGPGPVPHSDAYTLLGDVCLHDWPVQLRQFWHVVKIAEGYYGGENISDITIFFESFDFLGDKTVSVDGWIGLFTHYRIVFNL